MKRRLLSAFLAVMMVLTMAPVAFAADEDAENTAGDTGSSEVVSAVAKIGDTDYATLQAAVDAAKADDTITLLKDITVDGTDKATSRTVIDKPITLDLNDKTIKSPDNMGNNNKNFAALYISADVTINATTGGINTGTNGAYAINVMNGATLTINGGNYYGGGTAVQVQEGTANINGGTFACEPYGDPYGYKFLINCIDSAYKNGTAKVSIKGGSFVNFDPSDSASENPKGNFCASGYVAVKSGTDDAPVWTVEDHRVAEVGNIGYSTLSAAVAAANNGDTVTLLTNTAEDITIAQDKDITLDLNGKTLTNVNSDTITVNKGATLTINGEGTVDNVTHQKTTIYNKGTVTLNGGTYDRSKEDGIKDSNTYYTLLNHGTMTVANVTVNNKGGYSSLFENGYFNQKPETKNGIANPILTIESGNFTGGINTVKNDDDATMIINDGTFANYAQAAFQNHNIATINGGTFDGSTVYAILNCGVCTGNDAEHDKHQLIINDGKFSGKIRKGNDENGVHYDFGSIAIKGGYFTTDPSAYVASGYVAGTSDVSGYSYKVVAKTNTGSVEVKPDVADPEVTVSGSISEEDKQKVENAAKTVSAPTLGAETGDIVKDINEDTAKTLIEKATTVQGNNKKLYVQSSLKVEPTAYDAANKTLALKITPQYRIVASTAATADGIELGDNGKNAEVVQDYTPMNITKATVVTMELPAGFAVDNDAKLSIKHTKSNGTVEYYTGTVTEQSGKHLLTFTTNGFSPFVISVPAAAIESKVYPTLQAAVDSAKNGDIIDLYKDVAADIKVTVAKTIKFEVATNEKTFAKENIVAGANTTVKVTGDASPYTYEFTYTKPSSGGSSGGSSSGKTTYKVTTSAVNNGGVNASPSNAEKGATITITLSPDKGYKLDKLTVTDGSGKTVSTVKKSDTVYTFTMPASAVKVGVSYVKATETPSKPKFNDVSANDWFASAVDYVTGKGMMNGTADNTFSPKANTTRGMVVTVLYRLENQPSTSAASFTDVASGAYYANAVAWANANGIVSGYGSGKFGPNDKVTREQLAAILYRYAQYKKYDVSVGEDTNILSYDDAQSISTYAIPAIQWACGAGVVTGKSGSKLDPKGNATRAEVAAMLMRFCENVK